MTGTIDNVDHTMVPVHNLDESARKMRRLGFTLTPKSVHKGLGTANRCIMLAEQNYVEIIAIDSIDAPQPPFAKSLQNREGTYAVALASENAAAAVVAFRKNGMIVNDPFTFSRMATTSNGETEVSFTVIMIDPNELPQGMMFICQHHSREKLFTDDVKSHLNGALGIHSITAIVSDLDVAADSYGKLFGWDRIVRSEDFLTVSNEKTSLIFMTENYFISQYGAIYQPPTLPCFCVLSFSVASRLHTREFLLNAEIPFTEGLDGQLRIAPQEGCGDIIEFI